jgi:hypothetical protein
MRVSRPSRERAAVGQQRPGKDTHRSWTGCVPAWTSRALHYRHCSLVSELIEARDDEKVLRFQKQIASCEPLIGDEPGFASLSKTGAELLFEMLSQHYERGSTMVTSNLPFQEWTEFLGSEPLTAV